MEAEETAKTPFSLVSCVAVILVIAAVVGIGGFFGLRVIHDRRAAAEFVERIKVHDGARAADASPDALDRALPLLDPAEGLRFFARPTFSLDDYAVAIRLGANGAEGTLLVFDRGVKAVSSRAFTLSAQDYRALAASIDGILAEDETVPRYCTDGVSYVIERRAAGRARWGTNAFSCPLRYARVAAALHGLLKRDAPGPDLPTQDNWAKR